jgi:hypothetical protein
MKKLFLLAAGILLLYTAVFAQTVPVSDSTVVAVKLKNEPRFYLTVHTGYAVALGSTFQFYPDDITRIAVTQPASGSASKQVTYQAQTHGLGEGFRIGGGLSFVVNDFLNVGIDLDYFHSTISRTRDSSMQQTTTSGGGTVTSNFQQKNTISYEASLLTFAPNITFKAISRPKFFIYNKVGAIIVLKPKAIQHGHETDQWSNSAQGIVKDSSASSVSRYDWGIHGPAFGFMGAIGAQVKLTERVRAFTELQFTHVLYVIKNRITTNYVVDGQEMVSTLTTSEREIQFEKNLTNNTASANPNQPTVTVTQRFPLTYVGLQLGLAYRF